MKNKEKKSKVIRFDRPFADVTGIIEFGKICRYTIPRPQESIKKICIYDGDGVRDEELCLWIALDKYAIVVNVARGYYYVHGYGS